MVPSLARWLRLWSLACRVALILVLLAGFYLLGILIAAGLLYLPYAEWRTSGLGGFLILAFVAIAGAGPILWALVPRRDRFKPAGPRLNLGEHPKLATLIRRVADSAGQAMPEEVYLIVGPTAAVEERGGVLLSGNRRIMEIGLSLMARLTVGQFAAVIAHEFGHFHRGDTVVGPWIHQIRGVIGRTLETTRSQAGLLRAPFRWYAGLFLRITHGMSRAQEYAADALAARVVGSALVAQGLRASYPLWTTFELFWRREFEPLVRLGYRPPLLEGLDRLIDNPVVSQWLEASFPDLSARTSPYASHPPLQSRLAALAPEHESGEWDNSARATTLLERVEQVERDLINWMIVQGDPADLIPISWSEAPGVWAADWRMTACANAGLLKGVSPVLLAWLPPRPDSLARKLWLRDGAGLVNGEAQAAAANVFGAAFATALLDRGWTLRAELGESIILFKEGIGIRPFEVWFQICEGEPAQSTWQELMEQQGLADIDLGDIASEPVG